MARETILRRLTSLILTYDSDAVMKLDGNFFTITLRTFDANFNIETTTHIVESTRKGVRSWLKDL